MPEFKKGPDLFKDLFMYRCLQMLSKTLLVKEKLKDILQIGEGAISRLLSDPSGVTI